MTNIRASDDILFRALAVMSQVWDLTSLIKGDGTFNIVLLTFNGDPLSFASREAIPPYQPQLVVDVLGRFNSASPSATQEFDNTDPWGETALLSC